MPIDRGRVRRRHYSRIVDHARHGAASYSPPGEGTDRGEGGEVERVALHASFGVLPEDVARDLVPRGYVPARGWRTYRIVRVRRCVRVFMTGIEVVLHRGT